MINIQENIPLAPLTTFKIGGAARFFVEAETVADVMEAVSFAQTKGVKIVYSRRWE
jgi:UDP-N-acetylmuramate dehydrogenase